MSTVTKFPQKQVTSSGGKYQPFKQSSLKNIKTKSTKTYAETDGMVHGKKQPVNRPGTLTLSNFKCGLPTGSIVTQIEVFYTHSKTEENKKSCNIPAPTISLMNGDKAFRWSNNTPMSKTGKAPTTKVVTNSLTFKRTFDGADINSSNFGVRINYPTNANNEEGYLRVYNVYVVVTYRSPSYALKVTGSKLINTGYNGDPYHIGIELTNKNNTKVIPTITLTAPLGFSFVSADGNGTITKVQNNVYTWKPSKMINNPKPSIMVTFLPNITFPSGSTKYEGTFSVSLGSLSSSYKAVITPKPANETATGETTPQTDINVPLDGQPASKSSILILKENEIVDPGEGNNFHLEYNVDELPKFDDDTPVYISSEVSPGAFRFYWNSMWQSYIELTYADLKTMEGLFETSIMSVSAGLQKLQIFAVDDEDEEHVLAEQYIEVIPATLTTPYYNILQLTTEELNRLGHGTSYVVQTNMKNTSSHDWISDWGNNFRIGVFNNAIEENITIINVPSEDENEEPTSIVVDSTDYDALTPTEIFTHAEYWSEALTTPNEFESKEVKFPYNKDYPLYILITGDYPESSSYQSNSVQFTEPCIIEDNFYDGREANGTYPIPIENTLSNDGDFAELNIESLGVATPLIYYDIPVDEDYGTNEEIAVRGIEVNGNIQQNTDDLTIYCKLISPTGESRTRSISLDTLDTTLNNNNLFSIGGMGDLWGLSTLDITNLKDWEIEFMVDNTINNNTGTINYTDISITFYIAEIDTQRIQCKVEDEDLSYYGVFIQDVDIPEGLKTDTDYLTIDGTDTNDPYRQNIREKEITIELDIGDNCDLEAATRGLRDLARLFTNKRDKYNRPIPKRISFSHYPDVYWEYIMESPFDNPIDISTYNVKIKLTVPSGTAYKVQETSTNRVGYVSGLANISPVIVIKPTDQLMTITETLTDQNFNLTAPSDITDKVIVIDCEDRIVWLKTDEDDKDGDNITNYVDWNSDWFTLIEEYEFETVGCVIKDVSYIERW